MHEAHKIQDFAAKFFPEKMEKYHVPGAALVFVKDGQILFSQGYGYGNLETKNPVIPEQTIFRVGSISKLFTATAVMQLAEQKKLQLNDNINQFLDKSFQISDTYSKPITLANILTHTDGFDFGWGSGVFARSHQKLVPLGDFLKQNLPPRIYLPGEIYLYGSVGMTLAGHIIEKITGVSFHKYIQENIFKPLEMNQSSFSQPLPDQLNQNLAIGYKYHKGKFIPRPFGYFQSPPAGSLSATPTDIAHFLIAHLQDGQYKESSILQKDTVQEMQNQQFTVNPNMAGATYGFYERFFQGERIIEHSGRLNGYNSLLFLLPKDNLGFFLACNTNGGKLINEFRTEFLENYYPEQEQASINRASIPEPVTPASSLKHLSGIYRLNQYAHNSMDKLGVLLGVAPEIKLKMNNDQTLTLSDNPQEKWIQVAPLLFLSQKKRNYITFKKINGRMHLFQGDRAFLTFEKLAWYEPVRVQVIVFIICLIIFLVTLVLWLVQLTFQLSILNNIIDAPWLKESAILLAMVNIIFTFGLYLAFIRLDFWQLLYELPKVVKFLVQLPKVSAFLGASLGALVIVSLMKEGNFLALKIWYFIIALAGINFTLYLKYWNLL